MQTHSRVSCSFKNTFEVTAKSRNNPCTSHSLYTRPSLSATSLGGPTYLGTSRWCPNTSLLSPIWRLSFVLSTLSNKATVIQHLVYSFHENSAQHAPLGLTVPTCISIVFISWIWASNMSRPCGCISWTIGLFLLLFLRPVQVTGLKYSGSTGLCSCVCVCMDIIWLWSNVRMRCLWICTKTIAKLGRARRPSLAAWKNTSLQLLHLWA